MSDWFDSLDSSSQSSKGGDWFDNLNSQPTSNKNMSYGEEFSRIGKGMVGEAPSVPGSILSGITAPFVHPYDSIIKPGAEQLGKGIDQFKSNPLQALGSIVSGLTGTGSFGNAVDDTLTKVDRNSPKFNPEGAGSNITNIGGPVAMGEVLPVINKVTGGKVLGGAANIVSRSKMTNATRDALTPTETPDELLNNAKQSASDNANQKMNDLQQQHGDIESNFKDLQAKVRADANRATKTSQYYKKIEPTPDPDRDPDLPPPEPTYRKIEAPIPAEATQAVAQKSLNIINKQFGSAPIGDAKIRRVASNLSALADIDEAFDKEGNTLQTHVTSFHKLDNLRDAVGDYLNGRVSGDSPTPDPMLESMQDISKAVNKDIDAGLQQWSPEAYSKYVARNNRYIDLANKVDDIKSQQALKSGIDPQTNYESLSKESLASPDKAQEFLNKTGNDRDTLSKMATKKLLEDATDPETGAFDAGAAYSALRSNKVYKVALPASMQMEELFKRLSSNQRGVGGAINKLPKKAFTISHYGNPVINGIGLALLTHHPGIAAGVIGLKLTGGVFNKLMKNPTTARAIINGASMPLGGAAVPAFSRIMLNGLKGTSGLTVQDENGNEYDGSVTNDGKIKIDQ